ncbi:hypothetical protein [Streptomyces odontomachi]|uniref:hypothetical protein n=1 Tax=Streptomyces odontomachi TaxID=2944940 RepID=UPI002109A4D0|nr:hypothetical protein [Streptomyces sp. ODS25]
MKSRTPRTRSGAVVALSTVVAFAAGSTVALADGGSTPSATASPTPSATASATPGTEAHAPSGDGAHALCKRVPKIDHRIDRALKRLNAGQKVRGSIARLQRRVDNADKAGHDAVKTYLDDKLTFRKSLVPTLHQRQKDLDDVKTWCLSHDDGKQEK